ncbi:TorF family putative porin [Shewanella surugensis]|uniref:TorF family putative porin n=1 Tax=Shewanella surugensis TaxID=212020 RepID=A0ABT0LHT4_9GAMM|nr:TorF family putative porin [Shewanella surugensis]MCL1127277.1 TorF family putative porin [Shewanella surugensis]
MSKTLLILSSVGLLASTSNAYAALSSTVTATSDYMFNGVSQTNNNPALQASLDYAADNGWYVGAFTSNVDFGSGDSTWLELDGYGGKYFQLTNTFSLDAGLAYYTYHGDDASSDYNYPELYTKFGYDSSIGHSELNFWYTWDYFGYGGSHYIGMAAHTFTLAEGHDIRFSFDRSTSGDKDKWPWGDDRAYNHYRIAYMTNVKSFDLTVSAEDTNMDLYVSGKNVSDARFVVSVAKTFNF